MLRKYKATSDSAVNERSIRPDNGRPSWAMVGESGVIASGMRVLEFFFSRLAKQGRTVKIDNVNKKSRYEIIANHSQ